MFEPPMVMFRVIETGEPIGEPCTAELESVTRAHASAAAVTRICGKNRKRDAMTRC